MPTHRSFRRTAGSIGFFSGGRLLTIALGSGTVTPLANVFEARGGTWSEDGTIVFAPRPDGPLYRMAATGGEMTQVTTLNPETGETTHRWPQFLPGGKSFIYTAHGLAGTAKAGDVIVQTGTERRTVHRGGLFGRYSRSGHLLYVNGGKLFAAPFDANRLQETGPSVAVVDDIAYSPLNGTAQDLALQRGHIGVSTRAQPEPEAACGWIRQVRCNRCEMSPPSTRRRGFRLTAAASLLDISDGTQSDIWIYALARDAITRLTFYADNDVSPVWSADGQRIAYSSWRPDVGTFNLFLVRADGSGEPQRLTTSKNRQNPIAWHPAGNTCWSPRIPTPPEGISCCCRLTSRPAAQ